LIRIAITAEAFEAVAHILPGSVGFEREPNDKGERLIWLETRVVAKLAALRGPGESYSDVILRLIKAGRSKSPRRDFVYELEARGKALTPASTMPRDGSPILSDIREPSSERR
jgi:hypothetical protein